MPAPMIVTLACAGVFAAAGATELNMDDPSILYSPFNWVVAPTGAKTINPGAYFRVIFSGQQVELATSTGALMAPFPQFWSRVDGGPLVQHTLAAGNPNFNISLGPPFSASKKHLLEIIVKSTTETKPRWWPSQATGVIFTGLSFADGATTELPRRKPYNVLIYGDSITEGVRTLGYEGIADDTDRNDAVRDYSFQIGIMLAAEVGIVAFGGSGFTHNGSGNVPPLKVSWNQQWAGEPRSFASLQPDLVVYNEGTNDGARDITADFVTVVKALQGVAPKAKQLLLVPFDGQQKANIEATVAAVGSPSVVVGDTEGFYSGEDGLHPFGYNHVGMIAPLVAKLCLPLL